MSKNTETIEDKEYFQVYSTDDNDSMKTIGQIIKTPRSLKIFQLLVDEELTSSEIGKRIEKIDNPRLPILSHHLQKMVKVGLLTSSVKRSTRRGREKTYYKAKAEVIIFAKEEVKEKISGSSKMKDLFKELINNIKSEMDRNSRMVAMSTIFALPLVSLIMFTLILVAVPINYCGFCDVIHQKYINDVTVMIITLAGMFPICYYLYWKRTKKLDELIASNLKFHKD